MTKIRDLTECGILRVSLMGRQIKKIYKKVLETIAPSCIAIFFRERFSVVFREYVLATFLICVCVVIFFQLYFPLLCVYEIRCLFLYIS